ncbi:MAG TPA: DUF3253 domain-containing protein [Phycisphaerales bacterium]|nr:DUF3253 domain-containing protein [Phycisphaerales bacterium]
MTDPELREKIRREMLHIAAKRGPEKSLCPSEVARAAAEDWRPLMPLVRQIAAEELAEGRIRVTQKGKDVHPLEARGPIRLSATYNC